MILENQTITDEELERMEKTLGKLEGRVDSMDKVLEDLNDSINGNGKEGIKQTIIRLEERQMSMERSATIREQKLDALLTSVGKTNGLLEAQTGKLEAHLQSPILHNLPGLIKSAELKFLGRLVAYLIIGHLLLDMILPADFSLWDFISKIFF